MPLLPPSITASITASVACLLAAACGGSSEPGEDWSGEPLAATSSDIDGHAFSIQLPKRMINADGPGRFWRADMGDYFSEPTVYVLWSSMPKSVDDALASLFDRDKLDIVKQEQRDGRIVIATRTKKPGILSVITYTPAGDGRAFECNASQARNSGVPSPDKTHAWLESICTSVAAK